MNKDRTKRSLDLAAQLYTGDEMSDWDVIQKNWSAAVQEVVVRIAKLILEDNKDED